MKYGRTFQAQSVPQWAPYNIDYNELKTLIKVHTSKDQAQAIAIPGQVDTSLAKFEQAFFTELSDQHDRVDLFVNSKADEISRRLDFLQSAIPRLLARVVYSSKKPISQKKWEKFAKYDRQVTRCGDEIRSLQRFVDAQRTAFYKILKKYKKWTGSQVLGDRFKNEVLADPKSFTRRDFEPLLQQYNDLQTNLRASTPTSPELPSPVESRRPSVVQAPPVQQERQTYWNEFDDGSDVENEPYAIYVDPDAESQVFGAKAFAQVMERARVPMEKVRQWLSPMVSPGERRPLINSYFPDQGQATETDADIDDASSSDFPSGYATHYATFPSVRDQRFTRARERLLFRATVASFAASVVLLLIAGLLVATGKHKLRIEVDAGATVGIVSSLFFATLGFGTMLYRQQKLSWVHRGLVGATFAGVCILNGILLVIVVGDSGI